MCTSRRASLLAIVLAACAGSSASRGARSPERPAVVVDGDLAKPTTFSVSEMEPLADDVEWEHRGDRHRYRGVALDVLLERCGFSPGPDSPAADKLSGWRHVVVASADDGYQAVFSCAELFPAVGKTRAYLVWLRDGEALPERSGSFRLVVPSDQPAARSIYHLVRLTVVDARRVVPPAR